MREFYEDIREKKNIAASARHRVRGSKTRYVGLPSDGMTQAEWKRRNGTVATYNLKQPTDWAGLKAMPADLQKQYIERLRQDYKANAQAIAQMLGVGTSALRALTAQLDITFPRGGGGKMSAAEQKRWREFTTGEAPEEMPPEETPPAAGATLTAGELTFHGAVGEVLQQVWAILGNNRGRLTVSWEFEKENKT